MSSSVGPMVGNLVWSARQDALVWPFGWQGCWRAFFFLSNWLNFSLESLLDMLLDLPMVANGRAGDGRGEKALRWWWCWPTTLDPDLVEVLGTREGCLGGSATATTPQWQLEQCLDRCCCSLFESVNGICCVYEFVHLSLSLSRLICLNL